MTKLLRFWLPPTIWALAIFLFSTFPTAPVSQVYWREFLVKKSAHIIEYAILTIALYRAFRGYGVERGNSAIFSIFISVIYGATDEFHQSFTPGREPRVRDVVFDTIGALLAIYSLWNLLPKAPAKLKSWAKRLQII
ncbi:hypothetical protein A2985_04570 [Candidatus Woesebacteria bacterium RIFCSPLOWO2_01_FULL_43_11]|nr:MAG: hypothetical protein A2985_04570 [Candidatus Woesebacteria bacterium RIFCSPLOWO2_01_FULL_43_11]